MKTAALVVLALLSWGQVWAAPAPVAASLDELLDQVRETRRVEEQANRQREQRFLAEKDRQRERLREVKAALDAERQRNAELQQRFDNNEETLATLEARLRERSGSLLELFGVVRQVAGDAAATFESSLISTQIGGRKALVTPVARSEVLPSIAQLEDLWFALQQEMTASGKVVSYPAHVIAADGRERERRVTRVGTFNAVSAGRFLRYLPESGKLQELPRQPAWRYRHMAAALERASSGMVPMAIDPSRGSVLALLVRIPDIMERIRQGRLVGYVIIAVGILGVLIAGERAFGLFRVGRRIGRQLTSDIPNRNNPLGRVMAVYQAHPGLSLETLELKLDESILKDIPRLQRGLATLKILAVIAPLLGLLGTVTGLIETFQSITLFGTGDPRLMAGGISQALVTTVLGLTAAIPLILLHSALTSKSKRLLSVLEEQSAGIVARHAERQERHARVA